MKEFNYKIAKQADSVIALGGGLSVSSNMDAILEYAKNNNSIIYVANYNFPTINADYTYLGNGNRFRHNITKINSSVVIVHRYTKKYSLGWLKNEKVPQYHKVHAKMWRDATEKHAIYKMGRGEAKKNRHLNKWKGNPDGSFQFFPSPAGYAILVLASMSQPKEMLFAGIDGPDDPRPGKVLYKKQWDGKQRKYRSFNEFKYKQRTLEKLALPFLIRRKIKLLTFEDSALWGLNRNKFGIENLK